MDRTTEQSRANTFDCELDRLVRRAEQCLGDHKDPAWRDAAMRLKTVRAIVRTRMHADDRAATAY